MHSLMQFITDHFNTIIDVDLFEMYYNTPIYDPNSKKYWPKTSV